MAHTEDRRYRVGGDGKKRKTGYTGDKPYRVRYRDPDGRERSRSFALKRDATRFESQVDTELARGEWVDHRLGQILLSEWVATVDPGLTGFKPSTRARDESYMRSLVLPEFGSTPLAAIDHMSVQRWVAALESREYAAETVKKAVGLLNRYLKEAVRAGRLVSLSTAEVRLPTIVRAEMRFLDATELAHLTAAMDPRYRAFVTLGAFTGLRAGEMLGLRVRNVSVLGRHVDVVEQLQEIKGHLEFGPPKTPASSRRVPLPQIVIDDLTEHLIGRDADETVFVAPRGGLVRLSHFRRRFWNPAVAKAVLNSTDNKKPCVIHSLRHTAVALWIDAAATPLDIKKRAGHESVSVVLDRYGHLFPGNEMAINDKLDEIGRSGREAAEQSTQVTTGTT